MKNIEQLAIGSKQEFYVHRKGTFVGNAPSFWAKDDCGYTCYINGAKRFGEKEAYGLYKGDPNKWEIFSCDEVDARLHLVFDIQDKRRLGTDLSCGHKFGYAKSLQQPSEPVGFVSGGFEEQIKLGNLIAVSSEPYEHLTRAIYTQPPNTASLEQYNKLLDALKDADELLGIEPFEHVAEEAADAHRNIRELIAEAERSAK